MKIAETAPTTAPPITNLPLSGVKEPITQPKPAPTTPASAILIGSASVAHLSAANRWGSIATSRPSPSLP